MNYEINHSISEYEGWSAAAYDFSEGMNIAIGNFKDILTTANEISEENTKLQDRISELEEFKKEALGVMKLWEEDICTFYEMQPWIEKFMAKWDEKERA